MPEMLYCPVCEEEKPYSHSGEVDLEICFPCADRIANLYYNALTGKYLTWQMGQSYHPKPAIKAADRWAVFKRDGYRCVKCPSETDLTVDHIEPQSLGGANSLENYQTLCRPCNSRKGKKT